MCYNCFPLVVCCCALLCCVLVSHLLHCFVSFGLVLVCLVLVCLVLVCLVLVCCVMGRSEGEGHCQTKPSTTQETTFGLNLISIFIWKERVSDGLRGVSFDFF